MGKIKVGIIGSGNIGTDLLIKLQRSNILDLAIVVGIDEKSEGLAIARERGVKTSANGIEDILKEEGLKIVFDATGARAHMKHAAQLKEAGIFAIDLTPAAVGPYVVPYINLDEHIHEQNVNLITCGAQSTVPLVYAISRVAEVEYAEIVSSIASKSAGLATRYNIDEFTITTSKSLEKVGGAKKGKAIIVLNPAEPPIMMQNTVYVMVNEVNDEKILKAIKKMVTKIQEYVPGYQLKHQPIFKDNLITIQLRVTGSGDYLPEYAGNLDIMTAAAVATGEKVAQMMSVKL